MRENKNEYTGVWVFSNVDVLEDFFLEKAIRENKLGRILIDKEANELLEEFRKKGIVDGIIVDGNEKNVKAIITEHFNVKNFGKDKRRNL